MATPEVQFAPALAVAFIPAGLSDFGAAGKLFLIAVLMSLRPARLATWFMVVTMRMTERPHMFFVVRLAIRSTPICALNEGTTLNVLDGTLPIWLERLPTTAQKLEHANHRMTRTNASVCQHTHASESVNHLRCRVAENHLLRFIVTNSVPVHHGNEVRASGLSSTIESSCGLRLRGYAAR